MDLLHRYIKGFFTWVFFSYLLLFPPKILRSLKSTNGWAYSISHTRDVRFSRSHDDFEIYHQQFDRVAYVKFFIREFFISENSVIICSKSSDVASILFSVSFTCMRMAFHISKANLYKLTQNPLAIDKVFMNFSKVQNNNLFLKKLEICQNDWKIWQFVRIDMKNRNHASLKLR